MDAASESEPILGRVSSETCVAPPGSRNWTHVRWVTPEEQQALDAEFDRLASDPDTVLVLLGSAERRQHERPLDEYGGYWALELPGQTTKIDDPDEIVEVIQEHLILGSGPSSWPECPNTEVIRFRAPNANGILVGGVREIRRFTSR